MAIKPKEIIPFDEEYEVVITFLRPKKEEISEESNGDIAERLAIAESLFGILPSTVTDEEVKEERMKRYERNYSNSIVPAISPEEFLEKIKDREEV